MSRELMKMVGVSLSSSLCTAVFVVACTASADKMDDDERGSGDDLAEDDGEDDGGSGSDDDDGDGPDDGDDDNGSADDDDGGLADLISDVAEMAATIGAQQAAIAALELEMAETLRWENGTHKTP